MFAELQDALRTSSMSVSDFMSSAGSVEHKFRVLFGLGNIRFINKKLPIIIVNNY